MGHSHYADKLLGKFSIRKTVLKREILVSLLKSKSPLSQGELIESLSGVLESVDRVSVYRNLNQLKAVGLIHEVEVNSYVCCSHECDAHPHLLFFCTSCEKHREVSDHVGIKNVMGALQPMGFFASSRPIYLRGICSQCV